MSADYTSQVRAMRTAKDDAFRREPMSPVPHHERKGFGGLRYYPPDPAWRFRARLAWHDEPKEVAMQASDGAVKRYLNVGFFELPIGGAKVVVQAYVAATLGGPSHGHDHEGGHAHDGGPGGDDHHGHVHAPTLFIPFRDRTSGKETYGAGRYLDVEPLDPHDDEYEVDFNLAYNPFCAYDDAFSCPFPPPENRLQVEIRAGERTYKD